MPIKLLIIEENEIKKEALKLCLNQNKGIQFKIIADFTLLDSETNANGYTHLISQSVIKNESFLEYGNFIALPALILNDAELDLSGASYTSTKSPLSYSTLFAFLVESTPISYAAIEEYAMDDTEFFEQLKGLMVDEFKHNFEEIPALIENKNLSELKSRSHQLSSKFAMLDLPRSAQLCKEVDVHILNDVEKQLDNMKLLLVDLEIVLAHLQ